MRNSQHVVSWRTYGLAFAVVLSPALMQSNGLTFTSCNTGDTRLSELAVEVAGQDQLALFDPDLPIYDVWLSTSVDSAVVRAIPMDLGSQVWVNYYSDVSALGYMQAQVGGGEVTVDLDPGESTLRVYVKAPGGASDTYDVTVHTGCGDCDDGLVCTADTCDAAQQVCVHNFIPDGGGQCVFPCTEQGIRDAIMVGEGPHTFACDGPTTVPVSAWIDVDNDVILDGEGNLTINGGPFQILTGVTAELHGFTLDGLGARCSRPPWVPPPCFQIPGINNLGTLTMTDSTVTGWFVGVFGGAVTVTNSTVSGNDVGIVSASSLTLTNSTVSGNMVGSGIEAFDALTLTNSTVSGNGGLGVFSDRGGATATVTNSTVSGNGDGGIVIVFGTTTVTNTIVDGDCFIEAGVSNGNNIESPGNTCSFDQISDQVDVTVADLNLGPLADNGGPTQTHKPGDGGLGSGSVAIDWIPQADCGVATDQRGQPRPETGGTMCDVGAFEVQP